MYFVLGGTKRIQRLPNLMSHHQIKISGTTITIYDDRPIQYCQPVQRSKII